MPPGMLWRKTPAPDAGVGGGSCRVGGATTALAVKAVMAVSSDYAADAGGLALEAHHRHQARGERDAVGAAPVLARARLADEHGQVARGRVLDVAEAEAAVRIATKPCAARLGVMNSNLPDLVDDDAAAAALGVRRRSQRSAGFRLRRSSIRSSCQRHIRMMPSSTCCAAPAALSRSRPASSSISERMQHALVLVPPASGSHQASLPPNRTRSTWSTSAALATAAARERAGQHHVAALIIHLHHQLVALGADLIRSFSAKGRRMYIA